MIVQQWWVITGDIIHTMYCNKISSINVNTADKERLECRQQATHTPVTSWLPKNLNNKSSLGFLDYWLLILIMKTEKKRKETHSPQKELGKWKGAQKATNKNQEGRSHVIAPVSRMYIIQESQSVSKLKEIKTDFWASRVIHIPHPGNMHVGQKKHTETKSRGL